MLSPIERSMLDKEQIKSLLYVHASSISNVRKLGKLVDEVISLKLVRQTLDDANDSGVAILSD